MFLSIYTYYFAKERKNEKPPISANRYYFEQKAINRKNDYHFRNHFTLKLIKFAFPQFLRIRFEKIEIIF